MYKQKVDMRMNFEGLRNLVEKNVEHSLINSYKYVFISRTKKIMKILEYKNNGWLMTTRKLDKGTFNVQLDKNIFTEMTELDLNQLIL